MRRRVVVAMALAILSSIPARRTCAQGSKPSLPNRMDLIAKFDELGLPVHAQHPRDVCSLFAITGLADFEQAKQSTAPHPMLSEEFLIWAANSATGMKGDQAMFYEAVHGLNTLGICREDLMPYVREINASRGPSPAALADAKERRARWRVHWIRRWNIMQPLTDEEFVAIKTALAEQHPVACGLRWPNTLKGSVLSDVPPRQDVHDGHSIVFAGFEDNAQLPGGGRFYFRNSWGTGWGNHGYGEMSYAYARAYANDALWLELESQNSEEPLERFEAESLQVSSKKKCELQMQEMNNWGSGMWSQHRHLFCPAQIDGSVTLRFPVRASGKFRLRVLATAAPDFGRLRFALDGKSVGPNVDLYSGRVCPSGSIELGAFEFKAGPHTLTATVAGKNNVSGGFSFGLDTIDLLPAN
jgi:hypothetical protein